MMLACAGTGGNGNNAGSTVAGSDSPPSTTTNPEVLQQGISSNSDDDVADSFLSDEEFLDMNSSNRGNAISPNELIKAHVA